MAFEGSSKRYQCGDCQQDFTWFQLMDSHRMSTEATAGSSEASKGAGHRGRGGARSGAGFPGRSQPPPEGCERNSGAYRVYVDCELKFRTQQWDQLPAAVRADKPDYATYQK